MSAPPTARAASLDRQVYLQRSHPLTARRLASRVLPLFWNGGSTTYQPTTDNSQLFPRSSSSLSAAAASTAASPPSSAPNFRVVIGASYVQRPEPVPKTQLAQAVVLPGRADKVLDDLPVLSSKLKNAPVLPGFGLPDWFRNPKKDGGSFDDDDNDDFVLPVTYDSTEERSHGGSSRPLSIHPECPAPASHEDAEFEADIDEVSRILSSRFASPEAIVIAMDCCSVRVSGRMVDKILRRFGSDWVAAFGFFMWAGAQEGYCHTADSCDLMVDILGKFKQFDLMWGLISQMGGTGGLVSLATMTKVMRRLAGASRWTDAIEAFNKMDRFGVMKDTKAMNVLLDTLCKERSVKRARGAFQELRGTIPPDEGSFNTLVHGWCKARMLNEARETMKEMEEHGFSPSVITYTSLIEAYCLEKDFQTVYALLNTMCSKGCPPNIITYTIVMHALGKASRTQEALDVFDKVKRDGCAPDASFYNSLIYILGRAGRLEDANSMVDEMCRTGVPPNVATFNTLISAACDHSQAENALKLLVKMEVHSCKPDIKTYTPLLKLCCKRQWMKILLFLICHMFKKDITPDFSTYTLLVSWLCRNGKPAQSCLFLEEMVLKGFTPKLETFDLLMEKLDKGNLHSAKKKVQLLMQTVAVKHDSSSDL